MTGWWIELARHWLRLPAGDATLPGDRAQRLTWNPGAGYLRYALLGLVANSLLSFPIALAMVAAGLAFVAAPATGAERTSVAIMGLLLAFGGGLMLFSIAFRYAVIRLELDMLRYTLTDQALRLRRGVVSVEEVTLSYVNVQNVKFVQGPLQRYFGIADLLVETAGGGGGLAAQPGQPQHGQGHRGLIKGVGDPEKLRDLILERVRQAKGSGLGDAHDDHHEGHRVPASGLSSPAALAMLRHIRDELAAANRSA